MHPQCATQHHAHPQEGPLSQSLDAAAAAAGLERFSSTRSLPPGTLLFDFDQPPSEIYLLLAGAVDVSIKRFTDSVVDVASLNVTSGSGVVGGAKDGCVAGAPPTERHFCCGPGSVFGGTDFVLQRPRSFRAVASAPTTVVAIGREGYQQLVRLAPEAAAFLQVGR